MKYLVTGAAGFIGSNIAKKLLDFGHQVVTIDNLSTGRESNIPRQCSFIRGDVDSDSIRQLDNTKFDAILHIAGQSSGEISFEDPVYDIKSNVISTVCLLDYAVKTGCSRFIYASTMSVYGEQKDKERYSESDILEPKSFYAIGKIASEQYMKIYHEQHGIKYTALRYFNVYGKGQSLENLKQGMVSIYLKQFIDNAFEKIVVKGSVDRFRDLSHVDDITEVSIESIHNKGFYNQIINVGTGKKTKVIDILKKIKEFLKSEKEICILEGTRGDQFGIYADVRKLNSIFKHKFIDFDKGLKRTIEEISDEM